MMEASRANVSFFFYILSIVFFYMWIRFELEVLSEPAAQACPLWAHVSSLRSLLDANFSALDITYVCDKINVSETYV